MAKLYPIQQNITNVNKGGRLQSVKFIVIHFVGAAGQAHGNATYFKNINRSASAHYFIDPNNIVQVVPDNTVAWHVGDGFSSKKGSRNGYVIPGQCTNNNSIGIELCQDTSTGRNVWEWQFHEKTVEQALELTKMLMLKYNVPIENVIRHYDVSGKNCPGNWNDNGRWTKWHEFKNRLASMLNQPQHTPQPQVQAQPQAPQSIKTSGVDYVNKTFKFNKNTAVVARPYLNEPALAWYSSGQIVKLDRLYYGKIYLWGSYIGGSGNRRYVILADVKGNQWQFHGQYV